MLSKLLDRLRGKRRTPPPMANPATRPYRAPAAPPPSGNDGSGFDPYNSGSFNAKPWERIKRR